MRQLSHRMPIIPPTQLVNCSYSAYTKETAATRPESHQRSWWIVHIRPTQKRLPPLVPNPTNAVGGLFIFDLHPESHGTVPVFPFSRAALAAARAAREKENTQEKRVVAFPGRLSMNDPPTALVGFRTPGSVSFA
jgi:hypothetical protein